MATAGAAAADDDSSHARELRDSLQKQMRSHEVAIAELGGLQSSRCVYQKNGNIYFKSTVGKAKSLEQNQLASVKAKLEKLNT